MRIIQEGPPEVKPGEEPGRVRVRAARRVPIGALLLLAGCGEMTAGGEGWELEALPRLAVEADARIGDSFDPDLGFTSLGSVAVDRDGFLYVLEGSVPEIRVYSDDGTLHRRIGGRGEGPGEFIMAPRFGIHGDTVWAFDFETRRITLFDREGTVLSARSVAEVPVALPQGYGYIFPSLMADDGLLSGFLGMVTGIPQGGAPTGVRPSDEIRVPFVRFDGTGQVVDTLGWMARPPPRMWRPPWEESPPWRFLEVAGHRRAVPNPPTVLPWWGALPDGYYAVEIPMATTPEEGVFTVTRIGVADDTVFSTAVRYRPVPYSDAELDSIADRAARGAAGGLPFGPGADTRPTDEHDAIVRALRGAMDFPPFKTPVQYGWRADDESIWIRLDTGVAPLGRWVLLAPYGNPRGIVELPAAVRPLWHEGDTFWAAEPDELQVPWLVRYRVQGL